MTESTEEQSPRCHSLHHRVITSLTRAADSVGLMPIFSRKLRDMEKSVASEGCNVTILGNGVSKAS
jgi:hypothetical protein